ncbi:type IV secretion system protein [Wolbachia endosymbiont (group E) of Neria commutata]|uniref:type IV secretion system protein n=1 Tax=Wolbachia endosymbiont (group E) of Neria commutata TaxID=3066149 RepID=UPI0031333C3A
MQSRLGNRWFRLLLFAAYMLIIGCSKNDMPFPRCISADYFGPEPVAVSAHFTSDHEDFIPEDGEIIDSDTGEINYGFHHNQVVKWKDTGLETNGDSLIVRVNGAWTSWSNNNKKESKGNYDLQSLEQLKYATKFEGGKGDNSLPDFHLVCNDYKIKKQDLSNCSDVNCKCIDEGKDTNMISRGVPCWFTNGHGAYLLFRRSSIGSDGKKTFIDSDPNENLKSMRNPPSPTIHLGYNSTAEGESGVFTLERNSNKLKDEKCDVLPLEKGWKIYVKILDGYYLDNAGGYSFEFLGGVQHPSEPKFFDEVYKYLKCVLLINKNCKAYFNSDEPAAAQAMFKNIVKEGSSFHNFVLSLLVLFIVISSLLYLFGMIQETKHDMLIRMMKFTLVVVLISPGSFEFFYNHFLVLFVESLEQLIKIITNFAPNSNADELFSFMGNMYDKFFAYSVWKKFAAFFHYQMWASIFMVPAIFIGIVLYFLLCLYAFIIFLSGFMGIAFLIAIMPLFLISILFSQLKSLFEGWIKFCISFCLQSVMMFTLLSLLAAIIMNTFYRQLGFTVCYNKWLEIRLCAPSWMGGFCIQDKQYFGWTPGQVFVPYTIGEASPLNIDKSMEGMSRAGGTVKFTGGAGYIPLPPDYIEKGFRYIDYPFFNPVPGTERNPADHYIAENDIVVNKTCDLKDLVRLTNSLLHAVEQSEILLLISNIDKKLEGIDKEIIGDYKNGIIRSDLKNKIRLLVENIIKKNTSCRLQNFYKVNEKYQDNSDYQRVQDINRGYLINAAEIFILFLLSFLMFSLRKSVQEMGSNIAGGGYSVYSISSMYSPHANTGAGIGAGDLLGELVAEHVQKPIGGSLDALGNFVTGLPNRLAGGAANLVGRLLPMNVTILGKEFNLTKLDLNAPRKLVNTAIEATKFATSPKNDVDKLEAKIYRSFGVYEDDIEHRKIGKYLNYYKGCVGSHLGYTLEDAMKFTWEHGLDSTGKRGYEHNLLYRAKSHREEFLKKLHDYTIGYKRKPEKDKDEDGDSQSHESTNASPVDPTSGELLQAKTSPPSETVIRSTPSSRTTRNSLKGKAPSPPTLSEKKVSRDVPTDLPGQESDEEQS